MLHCFLGRGRSAVNVLYIERWKRSAGNVLRIIGRCLVFLERGEGLQIMYCILGRGKYVGNVWYFGEVE